MRNIIITVLLISCNIVSVYGAQSKQVKHTETLTVDLSIKDPNVISVRDDRVSQYLAAKNAIVGSVDTKSGVFSIKPTAPFYERPFSVVLFTEKGYRYTVIVNPKNIPAQDVVLVNNSISTRMGNKSGSVVATASRLIKAMINNKQIDGYVSRNIEDKADKKGYLGTGAEYQLYRKYQGESISGEMIYFTNNSNKTLNVKEEGFYSKDVIAVSLSGFSLKPKESLTIYRVVKNG